MAIRPIRIEGDVAFVPLTRGLEAVIDAADAAFVGQWNWCARVSRGHAYAGRAGSKKLGETKIKLLHRELLRAPDNLFVDHASGDGLDDRRQNLRLATPTQNHRNQRTSKANTSGAKGVSWHKRIGRWAANISVDGKSLHLGYYDTKELAQAAYAAASAEHHGEFGRTE